METTNAYHYQQSGLPNVWLLDGYSLKTNQYGEFVSVEDVEGLHRAIGCALVNKTDPLTGIEFRFLRRELDLSQHSLGEFYGVGRQSVALWEKKEEVSQTYDYFLRYLYTENLNSNEKLMDLVKRLNDMDRHEQERFSFTKKGDKWDKAA